MGVIRAGTLTHARIAAGTLTPCPNGHLLKNGWTRKPFPPPQCPMAEYCIAPAPTPVASPTVRPYHAVDYR